MLFNVKMYRENTIGVLCWLSGIKCILYMYLSVYVSSGLVESAAGMADLILIGSSHFTLCHEFTCYGTQYQCC